MATPSSVPTRRPVGRMRWSELQRTALEEGMTVKEVREFRTLDGIRLGIELHRLKP